MRIGNCQACFLVVSKGILEKDAKTKNAFQRRKGKWW